MAWITRAVNDTDHRFTLLQNDASWRPIVYGKRYAADEPIGIPPLTRQGQPWQMPFMPPGFTIPAPSDMVTNFPLEYCVVPWQGYRRLRLVGPTGRHIDYEVGRFVVPEKDHLRGILSNGETPLMVELGDSGGAWWSISYNFALYVQQDQGVRWVVESASRGIQPIVAAVGEELRKHAPEILKFLLG